jgi:carboxyl-terminal processing protease
MHGIRRSIALGLTAALAGIWPLAAQSPSYEQLQTFSSVLSQIRLNYVERVSTEQLVRAAIAGMLRSLDPHSRFVTHEQNDRFLAWEAGQLAGTGIVLEDEDGGISVEAVLKDSPAARAGVLPGDQVLALNDTLVMGSTARELQTRLIGDRGTRVRVQLARGRREQPETVTIAVRNEIIRPRSVATARQLPPGVGYIRLETFQARAGREVHEAAGQVLAGLRVRRLILDLRGNPGGQVQAAVDVASEFLPKGAVVCRIEGRRTDADRQYATTADGAFADVPLVVLIDEHTASAAEVLAGALQDHDRAVILGRRSFGKALVQRLFEVPPAGDAVWLTVGYVRTPSGRLIQRRYSGINAEQYFAAAGRGGAPTDTMTAFLTDGGRTVRGGGGIRPDSALPAPASPPLWWSAAADSNFDHSVADSVATTLAGDAAGRAAWLDAGAEWQTRLLLPFLDRVRSRLRLPAGLDSAQAIETAEILAARAAEVRWGTDFGEEFRLHNDSDVRAALAWFDRQAGTRSSAPH